MTMFLFCLGEIEKQTKINFNNKLRCMETKKIEEAFFKDSASIKDDNVLMCIYLWKI